MYRPVPYEMPEYFCTRCNANLELQKGFSPDLSSWVCRACGMMLTNPEEAAFDTTDDVVWICDGCGGCLNVQSGFEEWYLNRSTDENEDTLGEGDISDKERVRNWICTECGFENRICAGEIYLNDDSYRLEQLNPTKGMREEDILALSCYQEIDCLDERRKVLLVHDPESGKVFVEKILDTYDISVYRKLMDHPVSGMPRIIKLFEGERHLVIIEEYISGVTLEDMIGQAAGRNVPVFDENTAVGIMCGLCDIVSSLHAMDPPIIHRDIKPSNIIIDFDGKGRKNSEEDRDGAGLVVYLLDMDAAKFFKEHENRDTVLLGTREYAAPEQYGFGASSVRTDIYALGVLFDELLTGRQPGNDAGTKSGAGCGKYAGIVEKCTMIDPGDRYASVEELKAEVERVAAMQFH
ncbi:MAG: protein kinase [Lachnospiraceae bacterium]|nr:protein kinase [Lachnospiraceae bacterium]